METFSKCEMTSIRDLFFSSCSRRDGLSACAQLLAKWIQWDDAFLETESRGWGEEKKVKSLSCVWLFVIPWTVVNQAPPFMGLSRQGYWNELPFPSLGGGDDSRNEKKWMWETTCREKWQDSVHFSAQNFEWLISYWMKSWLLIMTFKIFYRLFSTHF